MTSHSADLQNGAFQPLLLGKMEDGFVSVHGAAGLLPLPEKV